MARSAMLCLFVCCMLLLGCAHQDRAKLLREADAARSLAEAHMAEGRYRMALGQLEKSIAVKPKDADTLYDLGVVYLALKQPALAVKAFKRALEISPNYAAVKNCLGTAYIALEQWEKAIAVFEDLSKNLLYVTPQYPLLNLGWIYYNKKEYLRSINNYKKALEYDPKFAEAWRGLGRTRLAMGQARKAAAALEKAVGFAPFFVQAWLELGKAYQAQGDMQKARAAWRKVINLASPDSAEAQSAKALLGSIN